MTTGDGGSDPTELIGSVQSGTFIPFLGAGASLVGPKGAAPWRSLVQRAKLIHAYTREPQDKLYLESQVNARSSFLGEIKDWRPDTTSAETTPETNPLLKLQVELVRLGSHLVEVFGDRMIAQRAAVVDPEDYRIRIAAEDQQKLAQVLLDVLDAALDLREHPAQAKTTTQGESPRLLPERIYDKLCSFFCWHMVDFASDSAAILDRLLPHEPHLCATGYVVGRPRVAELRLDELAWIEDLLWHTLRYNVPMYPNTGELNFYLSLGVATLPAMARGELAETAEWKVHLGVEPKEAVMQWLKYCDKHTKPSHFHLTLAAALWHGYTKLKSEGTQLALAFTTNYDRILEQAMESLRLPGDAALTYHVVFPVAADLLPEKDDGSAGSADQDLMKLKNRTTVWLMRTVTIEAGQRETKGLIDVTSANSDRLSEVVAGPIIVKLHGSPLEPLKPGDTYQDLDGVRSRARTLKHEVVLEESSYLRSILSPNGSPAIAVDALHDKRELWFLGYSLRDWNVRVRLFDQAFKAGPSAQRKSIAKDYDDFSSAILKTLAVKKHRFDLLEIEPVLLCVDQVAEIVKTTEQAGGW